MSGSARAGFDRRFALPIVAAFAGFVGFGAIVPVLPVHVRVDLGGSDVEIGFLVGLISIAALSTRIVSGRLVDARGGATGLVLGLGLCILAGPMFLAPLGLPGLVAARLTQGFGQAFLFGGCADLTVALAPADRRAHALGLLGVGTWGGMAIGPLFGAFIGSFAGTAVFVAVLPLVALAAVTRWRPAGASEPRALMAGRPRMLPREAIRPGVSLGLISVGSVSLSGFLVLRLGEVGGGGAIAFGAFASTVLLTRVFFSAAVDRSGPATAVIVGTVCFASGLVVVALAPDPLVGIAGATICGVGFGLPWPSLAAFTFGQVGANEKGGAIGVLTALSDLAMFVGAVLAGTIAGVLGYPAMFCCAAAAVLVSAAIVVPSMRSVRVRAPGGPEGQGTADFAEASAPAVIAER